MRLAWIILMILVPTKDTRHHIELIPRNIPFEFVEKRRDYLESYNYHVILTLDRGEFYWKLEYWKK